MKSNRREFLKAGGIAAAVAAVGVPQSSRAEAGCSSYAPKRILILGGTGFIGPHMVREALRRGHSVTLFNRGRTNNALFPDLETIKGDRDNGLDGLKGRQWDAVIDNSGYVPRHVQDSARLLAPNTDRYLYISTISVYENWDRANDESSPTAKLADESVEEVTGETYGPLKALCEQRAAAEIDAQKYTVLRPTYICGPGDHTDRFTYWPVRTRRGGEMIWPGKPADEMQIIDVRDLANFTIDCLDKEISGTFNTVTPVGEYSFGDLLQDCQAVTAADVTAMWTGDEFAYTEELVGSAMPIWGPSSGDNELVFRFSGEAAVKAGLHNRPPRETIRDLMTWWDTLDEDRRANIRAGMDAERELELIAKLKSAM